MVKKMFQLGWKTYGRFHHFFNYCLIGVSGVTIDFLVYSLLVWKCDLHYQYANVAGVCCGITNNFIWNYFVNFKSDRHLLLSFATFFTIGLLGLGISALLLHLFIKEMGVNEYIAKIFVIFVVTIVQFVLNKTITFRARKHVN